MPNTLTDAQVLRDDVTDLLAVLDGDTKICPNLTDVAALTNLLDLMVDFPGNEQRAHSCCRLTGRVTALSPVRCPASSSAHWSQPTRNLTGFRQLVIGDRDYRAVYRVLANGDVAVASVIGKRADSEVYELAIARLRLTHDVDVRGVADQLGNSFK